MLAKKAGHVGNSPTARRPWWQYAILIGLAAQTSGLISLMRMPFTHQELIYAPTVVVLMSEVSKIGASFVLLLLETRAKFFAVLHRDLVENWKDTLLTSVPALLYTIQTNLLFIAPQNLPPATLQVTSQFKILTTAFFSVTMLGRVLTTMQWGALVVLVMGVAVFHVTSASDEVDESAANEEAAIENEAILEFTDARVESYGTGMAAIAAVALMSGFTGVYIEKILKRKGAHQVSLWVRNIQLAGFSLIFASFGVWSHDGAAVAKKGLLHGFTGVVWCAVALQGLGGLLIAATVKHLDSIIKNFASAVSITTTGLISVYVLHDSELTAQFIVGSTLVILPTFIYGMKENPCRMRSTTVNLLPTIPSAKLEAPTPEKARPSYEAKIRLNEINQY